MSSVGAVNVSSDGDLSLHISDSDSQYNLTLRFNPLWTSHGEVYTCMVTIDIPLADVLVNSSADETVTVQSKSILNL